jgi:YfiH family protein
VVTVTSPGEHAGDPADAAVTAIPGAVLAVHTADCAPVFLVADGVVGVAHAGWRGLASGVLPATAAAMRELGAQDIRAVVGPLIRAECYEFGADDLDRVASVLGDEVRGLTAHGAPALDLRAGVERALRDAEVHEVLHEGDCTACGVDLFSHRARGDVGRQAAVVWLERT